VQGSSQEIPAFHFSVHCMSDQCLRVQMSPPAESSSTMMAAASEQQLAVPFVLEIDVGGGIQAPLEIFPGQVPAEAVGEFCKRHGLPGHVAGPLAEYLLDSYDFFQ
jgi:hypothetical protein